MEACRVRRALSRFVLAPLAVVLLPFLAGASHRTTNFVVEAPSPEIARTIAEPAEACRA